MEVWHWGAMPSEGSSYADIGIAWYDEGEEADYYEPNWWHERLAYIDGMDFNDPVWEDFTNSYASESEPAWSHFDCSSYAGNEWAIAFQFEEWGGSSGGAWEGWNLRRMHIWVEP